MEIIHNFHLHRSGADGTTIGSAIAAAATRLDDRKDTKSKSSSWSRTAPPTPVRYPRWWRRKRGQAGHRNLYHCRRHGKMAPGQRHGGAKHDSTNPRPENSPDHGRREHFRPRTWPPSTRRSPPIGKLGKKRGQGAYRPAILKNTSCTSSLQAALTLLGLSLQCSNPPRPLSTPFLP